MNNKVTGSNGGGAISSITPAVSVVAQTTQEGIINVYDFSGSLIMSLPNTFSKGKTALILPTTDLHQGVYFIQATFSNEVSDTVRFVKY